MLVKQNELESFVEFNVVLVLHNVRGLRCRQRVTGKYIHEMSVADVAKF